MSTLSEIARKRKADLKQLNKLSQQLDAKQEAVEREIKRIISRKKSVPEIADARRVIQLIAETNTALQAINQYTTKLASTWQTMG